jgi:hypothetical protein
MAGYSGTPLVKKLGLKDGFAVQLVNAPAHYRDLLGALPDSVEFVTRATASTDLVHLFTTKRTELARLLTSLRKTLGPAATVWVSWPKKSAGVPTEVTEDTVREVAVPLGWVDVKVCAVDETWSGLKLVVRKALR